MLAVIDTNVIVSALITRNEQSPTIQVLHCIFSGEIVPLYEDAILKEYREVLSRPKFKLTSSQIDRTVNFIKEHGMHCDRVAYLSDMPDEKDRVFYEVSLSIDESYLVTGNLKHFPQTPKVVTPSQMMELIHKEQA